MSAGISTVIGDQIRDLRRREGLSRDELAAAARSAGAPDNFTAAVVGFLETSRRLPRVDELVHLAAALEVSPIELLGDQGAAFAGAGPVGCDSCGGTPGPVELQVRADLEALADLAELEPSLAQIARGLARAVDTAARDGDAALPRLTRELRACLEQIAAGRRGRAEPDPDDGDDLDDLDEPDGGVDTPNLDDLPDDT